MVSDESVPASPTADDGPHLSDAEGAVLIDVGRVAGVKCPRCWRYVPSVSAETGYAGLCNRCVDALPETVSAG